MENPTDQIPMKSQFPRTNEEVSGVTHWSLKIGHWDLIGIWGPGHWDLARAAVRSRCIFDGSNVLDPRHREPRLFLIENDDAFEPAVGDVAGAAQAAADSDGGAIGCGQMQNRAAEDRQIV